MCLPRFSKSKITELKCNFLPQAISTNSPLDSHCDDNKKRVNKSTSNYHPDVQEDQPDVLTHSDHYLS